jgi:hypothetical protein
MQIIKLWIPILSASLLMTGCVTQQTAPVVKAPVKVEKKVKKKSTRAKAPKKDIKLKEVEDSNFSSEYMYPETKKKKEKPVTIAKADSTETVTPAASTSNMSKGECISMIGQEKFDKYTQMLGDEASAIKRCKMLKAM